MPGPLDDVTVLDLSEWIAAPYATKLLADILNRAGVLKGAQAAYAADGFMMDEEIREAYATAVHAFLEDVEEASIRGRRARLFGTVEGVLNPHCPPSDEELTELGGALVPARSQPS